MSLTIIDKTKAPTAKYVRHEHPALWKLKLPNSFKTQKEEDAYWDVEFDRWINGYAPGGNPEYRITGFQYFYQQEIKIKSLAGSGLIYPMWRDVDDLIFQSIEKAFAEKKDVLFGKKRGVGATSIFGGGAPLYFAMTEPGIAIPMTSADGDRVKKIMTEKLIPAYSNLHPYYKPAISSKTKEEIEFSEKSLKKADAGNVSGLMSSILCKQTQVTPTKFESVRTKYGLIDEIFLHKKLSEVRDSMSECFSEGGAKLGTLIMAGTSSGKEEEPEALLQAQDLWEKSETLGIIPVFIPGWYARDEVWNDRPLMINGHSDEKYATEYLHHKREMLEKGGAITQLKKFIKDHPLDVGEMFNISMSAVLPPEVLEILNKQKTFIYNSKPKIHVGEVTQDANGTLKFNPDRVNGKTKILADFMPDSRDVDVKHLHIFGTDPIPGNDSGEKGSDMATVALHRPTKTIVALRSERSHDVEQLTYHIINMQKLFHDAQNNIEKNHGGLAMDVYTREGLKNKLLCDAISQPDNKYDQRKNKKCFSAGTQINLRRHQLLVKYLLKHGHTIQFIEVINDILNSYSIGKNADITDALTSALLKDEDLNKREEKETKQTSVYQVPTLKMIGGKLQLAYHTMR